MAKFNSIRMLAMAAVAGAGLMGAASIGHAEGGLEGSWNGDGWISVAGGDREHARCHVRYTPTNGSQYAVTATCSTDSGKASQTGHVHKAGENSYKGSFYNSEYDVSGQVRITIRGNKQTMTMTSESATASVTLTR